MIIILNISLLKDLILSNLLFFKAFLDLYIIYIIRSIYKIDRKEYRYVNLLLIKNVFLYRIKLFY